MNDVFPIVPAQGRMLYVLLVAIGLLLLGVMALMYATARGSRDSRFEISNDGLRLRGDLYGRFIPAAKLRASEARIVDASDRSEFGPRFRTAGTAVPGYSAGWFRLRNGEKGLLYLTRRDRAVYVPTTDGYSLLLSPADPDRFVERIKSLAGGGR